MEIFDNPSDLKEIKISDILKESRDRGLVIVPGSKEPGAQRSELEKEAVALDAIELGVREAARIHGVSKSSVSEYANGKDVDGDTKSKILDAKHGIQDVAITKLMETLDMFDPRELTKPKDMVDVAGKLSQVVERMNPGARSSDAGVHLHFYSPRQKEVKDYKIIDV